MKAAWAVAAAAVVLAAAWLALRADSTSEAPAFALTSTGFENGTLGEPVAFTLADYRGRVVVLDFMAVDCVSCRVLTDQVLWPAHEAFGAQGMAIVSIDVWSGLPGQAGETVDEIVALQRQEGVPWRHAPDSDGVLRKYAATRLPQLAVVDREGRIAFSDSGAVSRAEVFDAIEGALAGGPSSGSIAQPGLVGLALAAGVAALFSPCAVGLLPAYLSVLLQRDQPTPAHPLRAAASGLAAAAGIVSLYALLAVLFWAAGDELRPWVPWLNPVLAAALVAVGLGMLAGGDWSGLARRLGHGRLGGGTGMFAFGVGSALAAFACTGPVFVPILLAAFLEGAATGITVLGAYALSAAAFMVAAAVAVAYGRGRLLARFAAPRAWLPKVSAVLLVAGGAYMLWYDWQALP